MCEMILSVQHGQTTALVMGVCNLSCYLSGIKLSLEIEHKIKGEFKEKGLWLKFSFHSPC